MKRYWVRVNEVWERTVVVEAETAEIAVAMVKSGEIPPPGVKHLFLFGCTLDDETKVEELVDEPKR